MSIAYDQSMKEGFVYPPNKITVPCSIYMARIVELREFISTFFGIIKTQAEIIGRLPEDVKIEVCPDSAFRKVNYNYSKHRQFVNEIMISRAVESLELYLSTVLREIFSAKPEMLKSEGQIDVSTIIDLNDYDLIINHIVENKIHGLMYKPLRDLVKYIKGRTNIDLFENQKFFEQYQVASEIRNLIAHNDCSENKLFSRRMSGVDHGIQIGLTGRLVLTDEFVRKLSYSMDAIVFRFDQIVSDKFSLVTVDSSSVSLKRGAESED